MVGLVKILQMPPGKVVVSTAESRLGEGKWCAQDIGRILLVENSFNSYVRSSPLPDHLHCTMHFTIW